MMTPWGPHDGADRATDHVSMDKFSRLMPSIKTLNPKLCTYVKIG
jgi:hypothetical protein